MIAVSNITCATRIPPIGRGRGTPRMVSASVANNESPDSGDVPEQNLSGKKTAELTTKVEDSFQDSISPVKDTAPGVFEALRFTGPGPELINSRLAMLGFVAALGAELSTHETVISQFRQAPLAIGGVVALITVATVVPIIRGVRRDSFGFLTPSAEVYNGRVAMLGLFFMIATELNTKHSIF